jgi:hypothetical protein
LCVKRVSAGHASTSRAVWSGLRPCARTYRLGTTTNTARPADAPYSPFPRPLNRYPRGLITTGSHCLPSPYADDGAVRDAERNPNPKPGAAIVPGASLSSSSFSSSHDSLDLAAILSFERHGHVKLNGLLPAHVCHPPAAPHLLRVPGRLRSHSPAPGSLRDDAGAAAVGGAVARGHARGGAHQLAAERAGAAGRGGALGHVRGAAGWRRADRVTACQWCGGSLHAGVCV